MRKQTYTHRIKLNTEQEKIEHIKWCRRNLGERGSDWDFSGSTNLDIVIYTEKYIPFYKLKFEN